MKNPKKKTDPSAPIAVAIPSIIPEKMEAIVHLSRAVYELSKALNSAHIQANISNNTIIGSKGSGILIEG